MLRKCYRLLLSVLTVAANGAIRSGRSFRRSRPARKFLQRGEHDLPVPPRSDLLADLLVVFREFLAEVVHRQDDPQRDERREQNELDGARGGVIVQELLNGSLVMIIRFSAPAGVALSLSREPGQWIGFRRSAVINCGDEHYPRPVPEAGSLAGGARICGEIVSGGPTFFGAVLSARVIPLLGQARTAVVSRSGAGVSTAISSSTIIVRELLSLQPAAPAQDEDPGAKRSASVR